MSLKNKILAAKPRFVDVEMGEWFSRVRVQSLSGSDRLALFDVILADEQAVKDGEKAKPYDQMIIQLIFALRDPKSGDRIFDIADHDQLLEISYRSLEKLYGAFIRLNMDEMVEEIETLKKSS